MIGIWRQLNTYLSVASRRYVAVFAVISLIAGLLEAAVLVLVVSVAVTVAESSGVSTINVPLADLGVGAALVLGLGAACTLVLVHVGVAHITARLGSEVLQSSRSRLLQAFAHTSWKRQAQEREGAIQETATSLATQAAEPTISVAGFASNGLGLITLLAMALVLDPVATIVVLVCGLLLVAVITPGTKNHSKQLRSLRQKQRGFSRTDESMGLSSHPVSGRRRRRFVSDW